MWYFWLSVCVKPLLWTFWLWKMVMITIKKHSILSWEISALKQHVILKSLEFLFHDFRLLYTFVFSPSIAIGVHASASVALLFFLFEQWECHIYWWILAICRLVFIQVSCIFMCPEVFFPWQLLHPALAVHCSASVSLSFFVFEKWECWTYWVILASCRLVCLYVHRHV